MGSVVGEVLPLALGVAISPIPIIAAILMLLSPKARSTSVGFLLGWVLGIVVAVVVFTLLSAVLPTGDASSGHPFIGVVQLVLGVLLLLLAIRQWRGRPKQGDTPKLPGWMNAIDSMTAGRAFILALLLSAVNPKNLMMAISAGLTIGTDGLRDWLTHSNATIMAVMLLVIGVALIGKGLGQFYVVRPW